MTNDSPKIMWRTRIGGTLFVVTYRYVWDGGPLYGYTTRLVNTIEGDDALVQKLDNYAGVPESLPVKEIKEGQHADAVKTLKIMYRCVARQVQQAIAGHFPVEY